MRRRECRRDGWLVGRDGGLIGRDRRGVFGLFVNARRSADESEVGLERGASSLRFGFGGGFGSGGGLKGRLSSGDGLDFGGRFGFGDGLGFGGGFGSGLVSDLEGLLDLGHHRSLGLLNARPQILVGGDWFGLGNGFDDGLRQRDGFRGGLRFGFDDRFGLRFGDGFDDGLRLRNGLRDGLRDGFDERFGFRFGFDDRFGFGDGFDDGLRLRNGFRDGLRFGFDERFGLGDGFDDGLRRGKGDGRHEEIGFGDRRRRFGNGGRDALRLAVVARPRKLGEASRHEATDLWSGQHVAHFATRLRRDEQRRSRTDRQAEKESEKPSHGSLLERPSV